MMFFDYAHPGCISIHALLAESDILKEVFNCVSFISIHALLAESDQVKQTCREEISISIHALLAESDNRYGRPIDVQFVFLSTLSLRRATAKVHKTVGHFLRI